MKTIRLKRQTRLIDHAIGFSSLRVAWLASLVAALFVTTAFSVLGQAERTSPKPAPSASASAEPTAPGASATGDLRGEEPEPTPPPNIGWFDKWLFYPQHAVPRNSNLHSLLNIFCAIIIGWAGAFAFLAGVRFGFISRDTRSKTMEFLTNPPWYRVVDRSVFYWLGGIVAGVFQWAQPDTLAPIQAFVLGATWPSVVTRVMAGGGSADTAADKLLSTPPEKIATPVGKSASDAIVPI